MNSTKDARVVGSKLHRDGPLQDGADALAQGPRGLRLDVRDRREDLQHVGGIDLRDRPAADTREGVAFEAAPPVLRVPPAAPAAALLFEHAPGGIGEGGDPLDTALVGQWVSAGPRQLAVGEGLLANFGERDERGAPRGFILAPAWQTPRPRHSLAAT